MAEKNSDEIKISGKCPFNTTLSQLFSNEHIYSENIDYLWGIQKFLFPNHLRAGCTLTKLCQRIQSPSVQFQKCN